MLRKRRTVYRVTSVRRGLTDDIRARQRRYAISMTIRTACFIGAIIASGPLRWSLFVAALILPYVAVVVANGGRERIQSPLPPVELPRRTQLPPVRDRDRP